jgi:hypothetical protein
MARFPLNIRVEPRLDGLLVTDERTHAAALRGRRFNYLLLDRLHNDPVYVPLDAAGSRQMHNGREVRLCPVNHLRTARRAWERSLRREFRAGRLDVVSRKREPSDGMAATLMLVATVIAGIVGGVILIVRWPAWPTNSGQFVLMCTGFLPVTIPLTALETPRLFRALRRPPIRCVRCTSLAIEIDRERGARESLRWTDLRRMSSSLLGIHLHDLDGRVLDAPRSRRIAALARMAIEGGRRHDPARLLQREKVLLGIFACGLVTAPLLMAAMRLPRRDGAATTFIEAAAMSVAIATGIVLLLVFSSRLARMAKRRDARRRRVRRCRAIRHTPRSP